MAISTITINDKSIQALTQAWSGNKLVFELPQSNIQLWELTVMSTANNSLGKITFCIRNDGNLRYSNFGVITLAITYDYNMHKLTVDLPSESYWLYSLKMLDTRH